MSTTTSEQADGSTLENGAVTEGTDFEVFRPRKSGARKVLGVAVVATLIGAAVVGTMRYSPFQGLFGKASPTTARAAPPPPAPKAPAPPPAAAAKPAAAPVAAALPEPPAPAPAPSNAAIASRRS